MENLEQVVESPSGNTLDCLDFVQGLSSFVISKCRKRHLRGTYLKLFPGEHAPGPARGSRLWRSLERLAASKAALF